MLNANEKHEYSALYTYLMQMKNMSIVPCIHTYCNEKHEYSALYTCFMQMKNTSIVPCIHT